MPLFCCPICKGKLVQNGNSLVCVKNHAFDISAQGYAHLLPANKMNSKIPGDSKQMVQGRRAFLQTDCYAAFSNTINQIAFQYLQNIFEPVIVDAGCGEGYYTFRLLNKFISENKTVHIAAFDISKFAIKAAAKKYKGIEYAVASSFDIPLSDSCADFLLCVFAPIVPSEMRRIIKKDGIMLLCVPTPMHLFGLKKVLYENPYLNERHDTSYPGFEFIKRLTVQDNITLENNEMILNLFSMTPYYWKTSPQAAQHLLQINHITTEIGFDFLIYKAL